MKDILLKAKSISLWDKVVLAVILKLSSHVRWEILGPSIGSLAVVVCQPSVFL